MKVLHEIHHFENVLHSTLSPQQGFCLMLPKCIKFESSDGFITQGSCGPGPQVKLSP